MAHPDHPSANDQLADDVPPKKYIICVQAGAGHNPPTAMELDPDSPTHGSEDKRAEPQCVSDHTCNEGFDIWILINLCLDFTDNVD